MNYYGGTAASRVILRPTLTVPGEGVCVCVWGVSVAAGGTDFGSEKWGRNG